MPTSAFLLCDGFNTDLYATTIYRRIKNLDNPNKPTTLVLLTFLHGCMTTRLVNDTGTFIPTSVFMEATPTSSLM